MSELGKTLRNNMGEQREVNQSLAHDGGSIPKLIMPLDDLEIEQLNLVIQQRNAGGFILDSSRLGTELGSGASTFVDVLRLTWIWDSQTELAKGTSGAKIDTTDGDLRLNM